MKFHFKKLASMLLAGLTLLIIIGWVGLSAWQSEREAAKTDSVNESSDQLESENRNTNRTVSDGGRQAQRVSADSAIPSDTGKGEPTTRPENRAKKVAGNASREAATSFYVRPRNSQNTFTNKAGPGFLTQNAADGDALDVVLGYLQSSDVAGFEDDDFSDPLVTNQYVSNHNGVSHLYLRQRFNGLEVYNGDMNVNLTKDGKIINLNNGFIPNLASEITQMDPVIPAHEAVKQAAVHLNLEAPVQLPIVEPAQGDDRKVVFEGAGISLDPIPAKLMYLPVEGKEVRMVWNTSLRLPDRKRWLELNVDAENGKVLSESSWMADADYHVFPLPLENPNDGGRTVETDPHDPASSPFGWHDTDGASGAEYTDTRGNNVDAQEDTDANNTGGNRPSGGAALSFDFPLDLSKRPETYQSASITNLFYWNNILHDVHYQYGFDEPAGNFQSNNYGNGGSQSDQVKADILDGAGYNNANFGTPPDGSNPRMQMFAWSGPAGSMTVNSPAPIAGAYSMSGAAFGTILNSDLTGNVVLANDGSAAPTRACGPLTNAAQISGNIALVDRGGCSFPDKAYYSQMAGARAIVIINSIPGGGTFEIGGWDPYIEIPVFMISYEDGQMLKNQLQSSTVNLTLPPRVDRDSALDNGVIIHEYGHGVSNRLTGGPSNSSALSAAQSRGMGEGWSDWWALVFTARPSDTATTSRGIGNYLLGQDQSGSGIRPSPYTTDMGVNSLTYGDVTDPFLSVPHGIGTIWCTTIWDVYWALVDSHGYSPDLYNGSSGNNLAMQLIMDGLKFQPANPSYLDARDGILLADQVNNGGANQDILWAAFARRGMGVSAYDGGSASSLDVVESFDTPNSLLITPAPGHIYESSHLSGQQYYYGFQLYTLENTGVAPVNWTASAPSNWLDLDVESGTLAPNESVVVKAYITNQLRVIGGGTFFDTVTFTNTTDGVVQERRAHMTVSRVPYAYDFTHQRVLMSAEPWTTDTLVSMDGEDSAKSGDIGDNESSWMETVVNGADTLTFFWKVSSEEGYDFLNLLVDGEVVQSISGEVNWTKVALEIPPGNHTVRWEYSKDYSLDGGDDAGWVDVMDRDFSTAPVITSDLATTGLAGKPFSYQIAATYSPTSYTAGSLPAGLSLNTNTGLISGIPATTGTFDVLIAAQNSQGSSDRNFDTTLTIVVGETAPFPFTENFESGVLDSHWVAETTNVGRVYPSQNNGPRNYWHLIMDTADNTGSRGELTLALDLAGQEDVVLSFFAKEFSDESNGPPAIPFVGHADFDGVAVSEDGNTWYEVFPLRGELRGGYTQFHVDLDAALSRYQLSYNSTFHIRFNHYGTQGIPADGIAIDDISIQSAVLGTTLEAAPSSNPSAPIFSGVSNPGAVIHLVSNLDGVIGTTTADGSGNWTISPVGLSAGTHRVVASVSGLPQASLIVTAGSIPPGDLNYELIPFGSLWNYLDDGSDQYSITTPFYSESYSDYNWASGNARLGYGGNGEKTVLDYGPDPADRHMVTYFRKRFEFDADALDGLYDKVILSLQVEDGAAVFLNGVELTRINMHVLPLTYTLQAYDYSNGDEETAGQAFEFDPSLLKDGTNLLAIGVHIRDDSSPDLGFDLRLALTQNAFFDPQVILTDPNAEEVLMADINQDGRMDIIYTVDPGPFYPNQSPLDPETAFSPGPAAVDEVRCAMALAGGGFGPPVVIDAIPGVDRIRIGDLDNDGDPDLIAADREDPNLEEGIRIYHSDGGVYSLAQHLNGFLPVDMALADFNGDGYLDLVHQNMTSYGGSAFIAWRANDQNGQFGAVQTLSSERSIWSIDAGDMDNDGDIDIVAAGGTQDQVLWWRNNGTGSFSVRRIAVEPSYRPRYFALGDMDGDSVLDYISSHGGTGWYRNRGNGVLRNRLGVTLNENSSRLNVADFDQDGDMDLVYLVDDQDIDLEWNENDGRGNMTGARLLPFGAQSDLNLKGLTTGDLDGDGKIDLLGTEEFTGKFLFYRNKLNAGPPITSFTVNDNTVGPGESVTLTWDATGATEVKLNGEIVAVAGSQTVEIGSEDSAFLLTADNGDGVSSRSVMVFVPESVFDPVSLVKQGTFSGMSQIAAADIDGNGTKDVVFASTETDDLGWLSNDGNQVFSDPVYLDEELDGVVYPIAEDFDKDGDIDIAALSTTDPLVYYENNGGGIFGSPQILSGSLTGTFMRATDANGDGWLDLVVSDAGGIGKVFVNNWNGGWTGPTNLPTGNFKDCRIADVTGDGVLDFLSENGSTIQVYPGTGNLQFPSGGGYIITPVGPLNLQSFELADLNGDGRLDVVYLEDAAAGFLIGIGDGQFNHLPNIFNGLPANLINSELADLDGDGDLDLVVLTLDPSGADSVFWLESDGGGAFSEPQLITDTIDESASIEVVDLDGDGDFDLLLPGLGDSISWIRSTSGTLSAPQLNPDSDSGEQDNLTNVERPEFSGLAAPGTVVTLESGLIGVNGFSGVVGTSSIIGTAVADGFGSWTITATKLTEGVHHLIVRTSSGATSTLDVTIDTVSSAPQQLRLTPETDTGISSTDGMTADRTPTVTGVAEAGSTVVLTSSRDGVIGSGSANAEFWITTSTLSPGIHQITAVATDIAGNVSIPSSPFPVTIESPPEINIEQPVNTSLTDGGSSISFGAVSIGSDAQRVFTVRNSGGSALTGFAVNIDGAGSDNYAAGALGATSLQPGEATTFAVTFTPVSTVSSAATLHLSSNDEDENPFDIALTGSGQAPEIDLEQPAGNALADGGSSVDFGSVDLSSDEALSFTVRNSGSGTLTGLSASIDGDDFSVSGFGATSLTSGQSTSFLVTFEPGALGIRNATLRVNSNDADENPFDVALTGSGIQPEIEVAYPEGASLSDGSSMIQFDEVFAVPPVSSDRVLTIRNTGATSLTGLSTSIDGSNADDFSASALAGTTLAPGESMLLTLTFSPGAAGERNAALHIHSNDADESSFDLTLKGTKVPETTLESWAQSFGLSGNSLLPTANDDGDGLTLIEEYAYNLNPLISDGSALASGVGTAGAPLIQLIGSGDSAKLNVEFIRRRTDAELSYIVEFGSEPIESQPDGFSAATEPELTTSLNGGWERVVITDSATVLTHPSRFGRVIIEYTNDSP